MLNQYLYTQLQKIGLIIRDNKPINEYQDRVKIVLNHVYGSTNYMNITNEQLEKIVLILNE